MRPENRAVIDAYAEAWALRDGQGDASSELLLAALRRQGAASLWSEPGPGRDLLIGLWDKSVPPWRFRLALLAAVPGLVKQTAAPLVEIYRLGDAETISWADRVGWMSMPAGRQALSRAWRVNDIALRHFHPRATRTTLSFTADPDAESLLRRGLSRRFSPDLEIKVWLRLDAPDALWTADVMVGTVHVGSTTLPSEAGRQLAELASRGVYADGVLDVSEGRQPGLPVQVDGLYCWLPAS